ncbi:hypothetical protein [Aliikangiella coralliicola]|uniref:Uncharacterized protein n=1 Tax=Aliikangiella coralliicola TaxID=2592383 RepID=A0A545UC82_9GAMM|nr:hypothetical protein [Aliikangiella coralliicola]TQV87067.1 hypothetical protein FLL46_14780 [Aliikangiella coralliicola]
MKVIFVYGQGAFWNAVFENGAEIGGYIDHDDALNAVYDESRVLDNREVETQQDCSLAENFERSQRSHTLT